MLLDEPLANVDVDLKRELLVAAAGAVPREATTVVHVTHDLREAVGARDRFAVIEAGRLVQQGSLDELRARRRRPSSGRSSWIDRGAGGRARGRDLRKGERDERHPDGGRTVAPGRHGAGRDVALRRAEAGRAAEGHVLRAHRQGAAREPGRSWRTRRRPARRTSSPRRTPTRPATASRLRRRDAVRDGPRPLGALQAGLGLGRPGGRPRLAVPRRGQLLHRPGERPREQRRALQGRGRPAHGPAGEGRGPDVRQEGARALGRLEHSRRPREGRALRGRPRTARSSTRSRTRRSPDPGGWGSGRRPTRSRASTT